MVSKQSSVRLVHMTTIPESLVFTTGQIACMKSKGFEVYLISSPGQYLRDFAAQEQVNYCSVKMPRRITPMQDIIAIFRLHRELRRIRPTIMHSHTPKGGLIGTMTAWAARVPVRIYHIHGLPFITATGLKRMLLRLSEKVSCRLATQVLCVSDSVREMAVSEGFCPPEKIKVLGHGSINGIDAVKMFSPAVVGASIRAEIRRKYDIPQDAIVLGFVGRMVRDKGMLELAAAWKTLREEFANLYLLMVGDYESHDPVSPEIGQMLRSDDRISITGEVRDVPPFYAAMDILTLPTYREGFPLVPMEAASMELPVVATQTTGCVDAVQDGITGTLVPPHNAEALAEAVRVYINDPELRKCHGKAGRERMLRDFRQEDIWEATYGEYQRLLEKAGISTSTFERHNPLEAI